MKVFSKFFEVLARRAGSQNPHWYTVLQEKSYKQKTFDVGIPMGDALLGKWCGSGVLLYDAFYHLATLQMLTDKRQTN